MGVCRSRVIQPKQYEHEVETPLDTMQRLTPCRTILALILVCVLLTSCSAPQVTGKDIAISISADGAVRNITIPSGTTVTQALQLAGFKLGDLDKLEQIGRAHV